MNRADIPNLKNNTISRNTSSSITTFNVKSIFTTSGITNYTFNLLSIESVGMVSYNGSVLARNIDYSVSSTTIELLFEVLENQLLTVSYMGNEGDSVIYNDTYLISSPIISGATDTQSIDDKVYYNLSQNKYEFYLDSVPDTKNVIMSVNGSVLSNNIEYYRSTTNNKRVIFNNDIKVGDIVEAIYLPKTGLLGGINTNKPIFTWSIANSPQPPVTGEFTLEIAAKDDLNFKSLIYSDVVPYVDTVSVIVSPLIGVYIFLFFTLYLNSSPAEAPTKVICDKYPFTLSTYGTTSL